jgi:hypothetical protein
MIRDEPEQAGLRETIEASVRSDESRKEVAAMGRTIAEALREEGRQEERVRSRQQTLLRQLRNKFGSLPKKMVQSVKATAEVKQLNTWLDRVVAAKTLEELEIRREE